MLLKFLTKEQSRLRDNETKFLFEQQRGSILDMFNMFSGGSLERMSIFALGVMPYISASIIIQMMTHVYSPLIQLRKEGERGRKE